MARNRWPTSYFDPAVLRAEGQVHAERIGALCVFWTSEALYIAPRGKWMRAAVKPHRPIAGITVRLTPARSS